MIVIDLMIWIILMVEIGHMTETGHIVETGTTPKNTKETGHTLEIDYMAEMIHMVETGYAVEIDHKTTVEMTIKRKITDIRQGLEITMRTPMRAGTVWINMNANSEMTAMARLVGLERDYLYDEDDIFHSKIERVHKILQTMSPEKEITIGFMITFSENPDKILDSICSPADVDHLISKRIE